METEPPISYDVKVLDGAAVVHLLPTTNITTFDEYANDAFIPYIKKHLDVLMLPITQPQIYGLLLVLVRTSCTSTSMPSAVLWEETNLWHFLFSTVLLAVMIRPHLFFGKGKKTARETWKSYPEAFLYMAGHPHIPITVEAQNASVSFSIRQDKQSRIR